VLDPALGPVRRLTVAEYEAMARAGILLPEDRVELIEGWLVEKMTKNPLHRAATRRARARLEALSPAGWYVDSQEPIVTEDSVPEPDVVVVRGDSEDYLERHPRAAEVALVVEVADTSLERDRRKALLYARAGVPAYWIVNLVDRLLEVHTEPGSAGYATRTTHAPGEVVTVAFSGTLVRLPVDELIP
jgi:Uma2 family endonuclease